MYAIELIMSNNTLSPQIINGDSLPANLHYDREQAEQLAQARTAWKPVKLDGRYFITGIVPKPKTAKPTTKARPKAKRTRAKAIQNEQGITRKSEAADVIAWLKQHVTLPAGSKAELVGAWVWLTCPQKLPKETFLLLSGAGFRYNRKRDVYQHCGGVPSRRGNAPRAKYGTQTIKVKTQKDE